MDGAQRETNEHRRHQPGDRPHEHSGSLRVAYLVNRYPMPTHSFIRREMAALESLGWRVERFTIRPTTGESVDEDDIREIDRTRVVLGDGAARRLARAVARTAVRRPRALWRATRQALKLGTAGNLRHHLLQFVYLAEACVLAEWFEQLDLEHVHVHHGTNASTVALLAHELIGITFSFTVHGPEEFDKPELLRLRVKVATASFTVGISSYGRSQILRWSDPTDWDKVTVVRCGIDEGYLDAAAQDIPDANRFVCVGRLDEQKGHLVLVEAVARLRTEGYDLHVTLIGDGSMREQIAGAIEAQGVSDLITLAGWRDSTAIRSELARSRAFVLPSFAEGLPVAIMEALALGRPVVTTAIAGIPELVDSTCGWVIPSGDADALAAAMRAVLQTPVDRLEQMGTIGRERVAAMHDARGQAELLAARFQHLVR